MAYAKQEYKGTWLHVLPHEIQNEIDECVQHDKFSETMTELVCELINDIPNNNIVVIGEPTKYQKLLQDVLDMLVQKSNTRLLGYISVQCISKYTDLYVMKNYRYKSLIGYTLEDYGQELYKYFTHLIVDVFHSHQKNPYNQLVMIKDRLTILNYQELLGLKNVIKNGLYHMTQIINDD